MRAEFNPSHISNTFTNSKGFVWHRKHYSRGTSWRTDPGHTKKWTHAIYHNLVCQSLFTSIWQLVQLVIDDLLHIPFSFPGMVCVQLLPTCGMQSSSRRLKCNHVALKIMLQQFLKMLIINALLPMYSRIQMNTLWAFFVAKLKFYLAKQLC